MIRVKVFGFTIASVEWEHPAPLVSIAHPAETIVERVVKDTSNWWTKTMLKRH